MKRLFCALLAVLCCIGMLCGCEDIGVPEGTKNPSPATGTETPTDNATTGSPVEEDGGTFLLVSPVDWYNNSAASGKHVAVAIGNGDADEGLFGEGLVVVYPLESQISYGDCVDAGFAVSVKMTSGFSYRFTTQYGQYALPACISTDTFDDGVVDVYRAAQGAEYVELAQAKNTTVSGMEKGYTNQYYVMTENWYCNDRRISSTDAQSVIHVKVGETGDENVYIQMYLDEAVPYGDDFVEAVSKKVANNEFETSVYVLKDGTLENAELLLGKPVDLKNCVFYQDVVAGIVAKNYGLTLLDKQFFCHLDSTYIEFRKRTDNGLISLTFDYFEGASKYKGRRLAYEDVKLQYELADYPEGTYYHSYTDAAGNVYEYFVNDSLNGLLVYKNQEFVGAVCSNQEGVIQSVGEIFGIWGPDAAPVA